MVLKGICTAVLCCTSIFAASNVTIKGNVTDGSKGIQGATVSLVKFPAVTTTTDSVGNFTLTGSTPVVAPYSVSIHGVPEFGVKAAALRFSIAAAINKGSIVYYSSSGRKAAAFTLDGLQAGSHQIGIPALGAGLYMLNITLDGVTSTMKLLNTGSLMQLSGICEARSSGGSFKRVAAAIDEILVEKSGFTSKMVAIDGYTKENLSIALEKTVVVACAGFKVPAVSALVANTKLPDPFKFIDGTRISKKADWPCLRKQLMALLTYSHGSLPDTIGDVTAAWTGGKLTITIKAGSKSESFSVTPKNVPSGTGPFPAIITLGGSTIPIPAGIAEIPLPQSTIADEKARTGAYSRLYGNSKAGSMLMWAWGVGRIIDGLEKTTGHNIDPKRLGVTGCSRNGKGAMVCGAFEERIALTLPMEGGSGGISSWRIAKVENGNKSAHPDGCQTASEIVGESGWLAPQFDQFATGSAGLDKLPVDAHTLAAICSPRGLYFVEGSMNSWNCNVCCWTAASAARMVYEALGVKSNIGIVMTDHAHCSGYGNAEKDAFNAFCKRFLLGDESTKTDYFSNDGKFDKLIDFTKWIDWTAPVLP